MRIKIINPNTTAALTADCLLAGRSVAAPGTEVLAGNPSSGVQSVESHFDESVAMAGVVEQVLLGEREGIDAYVIACFGDTGLGAAREVARGPVVGMTEAAVYTAALIAPVFSIVTLPRRTRIFAERALWHAGFERRCAPVRAIDVAVLDCVDDEAAVLEAVVAESLLALRDDHAEAIILGCAGMQGLVKPLSERLGVPVIEGVAAAVKLAESLVALGLATSKRGEFAWPEGKVTGRPPAVAFTRPAPP